MNRRDSKEYVYKITESPIGQLKLVGSDDGLAAILWENDNPDRVCLNIVGEDADHPVLIKAAQQLEQFFAGERQNFEIDLDVEGTNFQKTVWKALRTIPFGETRTYRDIAQQIGEPTAARPVGAATSKNPISIVTPCHRVIGSSGELTGFAGGLEAKVELLNHEGVVRKAVA